MQIETSCTARDSMDILAMAFKFKRVYNIREQYKKALLSLREEQNYRRGPDYVDTFDWNNSCGAEDAAYEAKCDFLRELQALRMAYQLQRGIGTQFKRHTDIVLGLRDY